MREETTVILSGVELGDIIEQHLLKLGYNISASNVRYKITDKAQTSIHMQHIIDEVKVDVVREDSLVE
ncbi:MAG: hypothetical protein KAS32_13610 [Candidatus Peribacteraceae bacterium]|nr:hypothetical protein [Candidatus Peribacteraceae bacterium]